MYVFPFDVPADLSVATDDELSALLPLIREHATSFSGTPVTQEVVAALQACRDLARTVTETIGFRADAASLAADIDTATTAPAVTAEPEVEPEVEPEPAAAVTAATRTRNPSVRAVAGQRATAPQLPADTAPVTATMHAATDIPGRFTTGQKLGGFGDAVTALTDQLDKYPRSRASAPVPAGRRVDVMTGIMDGGDVLRHEMRSFDRHGAVQIRREFPSNLRVEKNEDGFAAARFAADEKRLPGGSLIESVRQQIKGGRAITAAAGWCAPSATIYDLCGLSSLDGLLDLPELQTDRGGWQIPATGGPNFATVWNGIGNSGTTHIAEAGVVSETTKYCYDIPCPDFTDVRLGVDYVCLTGSLLQRRGYPEVVTWFTEQALTALPHKINMGVISAIVNASGAATVIPADLSGDDAISGLLSAVDLAIADAKYRNRMTFNGTLEVVLPMWVLVQLRAAGTRRNGVDLTAITDARIAEWFAIRKAVPRFVYDWQDAFSGLATGPGGANPLTALPLTVDFLIYPAGTWVKAVQPVVSLDTVYDSTRLTTNEYTAIFVEDGWAALQMCPLSRRYTAPVDPSGVVGCCPIS